MSHDHLICSLAFFTVINVYQNTVKATRDKLLLKTQGSRAQPNTDLNHGDINFLSSFYQVFYTLFKFAYFTLILWFLFGSCSCQSFELIIKICFTMTVFDNNNAGNTCKITVFFGLFHLGFFTLMLQFFGPII